MHGPTGYRSGVGIVLVNRDGLVFAGHRRDNREPPWQMPQGGLMAGETPYQAAFRELAEETGTAHAVIIANAPQIYRYDYPDIKSTKRAKNFRGQEHHWVLMRFTGQDQDIDLGATAPEFSDWCWMSTEEMVARVVPFKQPVYRAVLDGFTPMIHHLTHHTLPHSLLRNDPRAIG